MKIIDKLLDKIAKWYIESYLFITKKYKLIIIDNRHRHYAGQRIFYEYIQPYWEYDLVEVRFNIDLTNTQLDTLAFATVLNKSYHSDDSALPMMNELNYYFNSSKDECIYYEYFDKYLTEDNNAWRNDDE